MKSACFTGHRMLSGNITELDERLYNILERGIKKLGLTDFYAGGAVGWDTLSAKTVLKLREVYPFVKLHLILPCSNDEQTAKWTQMQKNDFRLILSFADIVEYTSKHYYNGCMKVRNARLVECATDCCFCFWNPHNKRSGTAQTVRLAYQNHIMIVNFFRA